MRANDNLAVAKNFVKVILIPRVPNSHIFPIPHENNLYPALLLFPGTFIWPPNEICFNY